MSHFIGSDVRIEFDGVDVSGDGRAVTYGGKFGSLELLSVSHARATAWEVLSPGTSGHMVVYPEGKSIGRPTESFTARITGHHSATPYDDIETASVGFVGGDVIQGLVGEELSILESV